MPGGGELRFATTDDGYVTAIARYTPDGTRVWRASPDFESNDAWVAARLEGGFVIVSSWPGGRARRGA